MRPQPSSLSVGWLCPRSAPLSTPSCLSLPVSERSGIFAGSTQTGGGEGSERRSFSPNYRGSYDPPTNSILALACANYEQTGGLQQG